MNPPYRFTLHDSSGTVLAVFPVDMNVTPMRGDTITFSIRISAEALLRLTPPYWEHEGVGLRG